MALWNLDARLAELARAGREPALRHIRLSWWSAQLAALADARPPAEPILRTVAGDLIAMIDGAALAGLADAWVAEALDDAEGTARGAHLFGLTGRLLGASNLVALEQAGRAWASTDRALNAMTPIWSPERFDHLRLHALPRPLAAVTAVARHIAHRRGKRSEGREQWLLFRVGLFGR